MNEDKITSEEKKESIIIDSSGAYGNLEIRYISNITKKVCGLLQIFSAENFVRYWISKEIIPELINYYHEIRKNEVEKKSELKEIYPKNWKHCIIHLNPDTGEMHSDGDHSVRKWIEQRINQNEGKSGNKEISCSYDKIDKVDYCDPTNSDIIPDIISLVKIEEDLKNGR